MTVRRDPRKTAAARAAVSQRLLAQVLEDRTTVRDDIELLLSSSGVDTSCMMLSFDEQGLKFVEECYWLVAEASDEQLVEIYERKMAVFLGECLIEAYGGEWVAYDGSEIVYSPVVVRIDRTGKHHDVFLLCTDLRRKERVLGQKQRRALRNFFRAAVHSGFS